MNNDAAFYEPDVVLAKGSKVPIKKAQSLNVTIWYWSQTGKLNLQQYAFGEAIKTFCLILLAIHSLGLMCVT